MHLSDTNYLSEIFKLVRHKVSTGHQDFYKIHFIFRNVITHDAVPPDYLANNLNLNIGETAKAGLAPRLTLARSECYWLLVSIPMIQKALASMGLPFPFKITLSYPESITQDDNGTYLTNPLLLQARGNIADSLKLMHHFAQNGEKSENEKDFIFNFNQFFYLKQIKGYVPIDENSLMFMAGNSDNLPMRTAITIGLNRAETEKKAMILERPRFWVTDYNTEKFGFFGDAKSLAKNLCPDYYPPSYEGRDLILAKQFIEVHKKIVIKPPSSANGKDVKILDYTNTDMNNFDAIFEAYLTDYQDPLRLIIQKYISGIETHGEVRVFVYDNKVMPVGIRLIPKNGETLCKIFMNATTEPVFLTERYLRIAQQFIEGSKNNGVYYYGLDILEDDKGKLYLTEANFLVSGFFDQIAYVMDTQFKALEKHIDTLPQDLQNIVIRSHLNETIYKQICRFLMTRPAMLGDISEGGRFYKNSIYNRKNHISKA